MTNRLEGLNLLREYYLGKLFAYNNAMNLVDPRFSGTLKEIINDVQVSLDFYNREIEKFKEELDNHTY